MKLLGNNTILLGLLGLFLVGCAANPTKEPNPKLIDMSIIDKVMKPSSELVTGRLDRNGDLIIERRLQ